LWQHLSAPAPTFPVTQNVPIPLGLDFRHPWYHIPFSWWSLWMLELGI